MENRSEKLIRLEDELDIIVKKQFLNTLIDSIPEISKLESIPEDIQLHNLNVIADRLMMIFHNSIDNIWEIIRQEFTRSSFNYFKICPHFYDDDGLKPDSEGKFKCQKDLTIQKQKNMFETLATMTYNGSILEIIESFSGKNQKTKAEFSNFLKLFVENELNT